MSVTILGGMLMPIKDNPRRGGGDRHPQEVHEWGSKG